MATSVKGTKAMFFENGVMTNLDPDAADNPEFFRR